MQIILQEVDINKALIGYLTTMGMDLTGKKVSASFKAKRKEGGGNEATLTIEDDTDAQQEPVLTAVPVIPPAEETTNSDDGEQASLELTNDSIAFDESQSA